MAKSKKASFSAADTLSLESSDGQVFQLNVEAAKLSGTLKEMIEDVGSKALSSPLKLPKVGGELLEKIVGYLVHHHEEDVVEEIGSDISDSITRDILGKSTISLYDKQFVYVDQSTLFELVLASNYLRITPLFDLTSRCVADLIKGKTPEEIRNAFDLDCDFGPADYERIRKENMWCDERTTG